MSGLSLGVAAAIADAFAWDRYKTVIDIDAAQAALPVQLALRHPHLTGGGFDLAPVGPAFARYVAEQGFSNRLRFYPGDFFSDPLPQADVLVMGHILHDWDLAEKHPDPQSAQGPAARRGLDRARIIDRRRPPNERVWTFDGSQHAHRNRRRL